MYVIGVDLGVMTMKDRYFTHCKVLEQMPHQQMLFSVWPKSSLSYLPTPPLGQDMTQGQFF